MVAAATEASVKELFMVRFIRTLALFALCAVLVAPLTAAAAPLAAGQPSQNRLAVGTGEFLSWLHSVLTSSWLKAGCRADPDGLCLLQPPPHTSARPGASTDTSENGCRI